MIDFDSVGDTLNLSLEFSEYCCGPKRSLTTLYVLLLFKPSHYQVDNEVDLVISQFNSLPYTMPFLDTTSAISRGCVLSNKYWMPPHRSLLAIMGKSGVALDY